MQPLAARWQLNVFSCCIVREKMGLWRKGLQRGGVKEICGARLQTCQCFCQMICRRTTGFSVFLSAWSEAAFLSSCNRKKKEEKKKKKSICNSSNHSAKAPSEAKQPQMNPQADLLNRPDPRYSSGEFWERSKVKASETCKSEGLVLWNFCVCKRYNGPQHLLELMVNDCSVHQMKLFANICNKIAPEKQLCAREE